MIFFSPVSMFTFGKYTFELEFMNPLSAPVNICLLICVSDMSHRPVESCVSRVLITLILCIRYTCGRVDRFKQVLQILHIIVEKIN